MVNVIDSKMDSDHQQLVKNILTELNLNNMEVTYDATAQSFSFKQDRRVVHVPLKLAEQGVNSDVRYLFRAILGSAKGVWNHSADDNDWGGESFYHS